MTFRIAFKALGRNKMRTGLTMLGMIIGVAAVITLVAMGNGAQSAIEDQIKGAGTNMITVNAGNFTQGGVRQGAGASSSLTEDDALAIRNEIPAAQYVAAGVQMRTQVVAGNQNWFTRIQGTDVDLPLIRAWPTRVGAFFSPQDVSGAAKVAVLGSTVSDQLFGAGCRSGRSDHQDPQSAIQSDRRDGIEGPGHGRGHGRSDPRAVHHGSEKAARGSTTSRRSPSRRRPPRAPTPSPMRSPSCSAPVTRSFLATTTISSSGRSRKSPTSAPRRPGR